MSVDLPCLLLALPALQHNIELMREWCESRDLELAPHIKTTMTAGIVRRQLEAGAWGVTVATARQAELAVQWGAERVVVANEVVHPQHLQRLLACTERAQIYVFVDSAVGAHLADRATTPSRTTKLRLLVDVGVPGGRTGVRGPDEALELARLVHDLPGVLLAGVAGYEGVRPSARDAETLAAVRSHCDATLDVLDRVTDLVETETVVFSMGGSAFPDVVAAAVRDRRARHLGARSHVAAPGFTAVLRSGCYVTHDHGTYASVSPLVGLTPALVVRALVVSAPEPGHAVIGAGRRELPSDAGLPVLLSAAASDGSPKPGVAGTATRIYDHHLVVTDVVGLAVGDVVDLGISHPCSAFDRWSELVVHGDDGAPIDHWDITFR